MREKMLGKKGKILGIIFALVFTTVTASVALPQPAYADDDAMCTTLLFGGKKCSEITSDDIKQLLFLVLGILIKGVGLLGAVGVLVAGGLYLTARDNEAQVAKAKKRLIETIIGLLVWSVFWFAYELVVPNMSKDEIKQGIEGATGQIDLGEERTA